MQKMLFTTLLNLVLGTVVLVSALAQDAGKPVQLRNHFEAGQTLYLDLLTTSKGVVTTKTADKPVQSPIDSKMKMVVSYQTQNVDQNQSAAIEIGYDQLILFGESLGNATQDLIVNLGLKDEKTQIRVDSIGNVKELTEKANANVPSQTVTRQMPYLKFPEQPISPGFTWHETRQIPYSSASKAMISHTTYTLETIVEEEGQSIAVIQTEMSVHETDIPVDSSQQSGQNVNFVVKFIYKEFSIAGKGEIRFSVSKGRILTIRDTQNVVIVQQGNADVNKASFAQDVQQQVVQETTATYSETSPLVSSEPEQGEVQSEQK